MRRNCRRLAAIQNWSAALALACVVLALAAALAGCATNPVTGRREISLVSAGQEQQMGAEGYTATLAEYGSYDDPAVQAYVAGVGHSLARVSHLPSLTWHFTVIDDDAVNAFAMPGGYIYVTRGIMTHLNSEAQLAGVMGHEIGHVTHRHSAEQITRQQFAGLGLAVGSVLSPTLARYGQVAQQGLQLLFLSFSRQHETEADELGVRYASAASYDPRQIPSTYAMLKRVSARAGSTLPPFLSTHPDPGDREVRTGELARAASAGKTGMTVRRDEYVDRLEGMVVGQDPRQGYFEGAEFYQPTMRFAITMPAGWTYQNSRSAVIAVAPQQAASMQLSVVSGDGLAPDAFVARLQGNGKIAAARGGMETVGGNPAWIGSLAVPGDNGQAQPIAAAFIRRSPTELFEVLGNGGDPGDPNVRAVFAAARSFHPLTDPARFSPVPARIHIVRVERAGTFASVIAGLGRQGADLEQLAIMNGRTVDDRIEPGERIKTVTPARLR
ncbi:MAG: M48 family metalloprotease [Candidatus Eisenbacteria bacterium]|uniref:M48 family metalloprotease n=1 Tax=Eiseniibacteriota bacterium TaxID=2212470 RepID=A0A9D6QMJ0_UNCEI|nr:M48 family metalloprotease [Candidatus Eisenbacteria bacterium]MBI3539813.1 M48 family metalloprotease [Candidatus Eisenbacteria bacterium]